MVVFTVNRVNCFVKNQPFGNTQENCIYLARGGLGSYKLTTQQQDGRFINLPIRQVFLGYTMRRKPTGNSGKLVMKNHVLKIISLH